jgi:fatty acid desaturase
VTANPIPAIRPDDDAAEPVRQPAPLRLAVPPAEADVVRYMLQATAIAIPILVAFWVGIIALAVSFGSGGYLVPIAMGVGVGVLAGVFWGTWMGFVRYSNAVDAEARRERLARRAQPRR